MADAPKMFTPEFLANPHPCVKKHLRETAPVVPVVYPGEMTIYFVTRFDEVRSVLADTRFSKDRSALTDGDLRPERFERDERLAAFHQNLNMVDPPNHSRLRRVVGRQLPPRKVRALEDRARAYARELLEKFAETGKADLIGDLVLPFAEKILGDFNGTDVLTAEENRFMRDKISLLISPPYDLRLDDFEVLKHEIMEVIVTLLERREANPNDCVFSGFIAERDAGELSELELFALTITMLFSGIESVIAFTGTALHSLLRNPEQLELLKARPELLQNAIEELIRYDSGTQIGTFRFTREEIEVGGVAIPAGSTVCPLLAAAHRDPAKFANPDRLDITREDNHHLGFGLGIHNCIGALFGRMLAGIAVEAIVTGLADVRLAVEPADLKWKPGLLHRALFELPVAFAPVGVPA